MAKPAFVFVLLFILFSVVSLGVRAQDAPTLSEGDQLRLRNLELTAEIVQLRLQLTVAALQRPGFSLERGPDGVWRYTRISER
jgi:hypothetical protein